MTNMPVKLHNHGKNAVPRKCCEELPTWSQGPIKAVREGKQGEFCIFLKDM